MILIAFTKCDSPQGGVNDVRKMFQLMERCDSHGRSVQSAWGCVTDVRKCDSHQGNVKSIRKVCQLIERCDGHGGEVKMLEEV